ncbi:MAG TPA: hypothetical protein VLG74_01130 [Blastocatellia bacterium]|nr:hypothetical protein [Blastocatellia bacterium]
MGSYRLQQWLLRVGLLISAVLLIRFAIDFSDGMKWWLAVPFDALVIAALGVGAANVSGKASSESVMVDLCRRDSKRALMLAAIPLGFLASSLDCTGLSLQGCSSFCTFVKLAWIPMIATFCMVCLLTGVQGWLTAIAAMSLVPVVPHCVCYNIGNSWWIDRIGTSPLCYGWGVVVSVIAIGTLRGGSNSRLSLALSFTIIGGACAFFVAHHYFQFPW